MSNQSERPGGPRRTPMAAHGEPGVWLMCLALVLSLSLIFGLLTLVVSRGVATFRVRPIERVTLESGEVFLGQPSGRELIGGTGEDWRVRYRVGNRDLGQQSFRWVEESEITGTERPEAAMLVERTAWGVFLGYPERLLRIGADGETSVLIEGEEETLAALPEALDRARERTEEIDRIARGQIPSIESDLAEIGWERRRLIRASDSVPTGLGLAPWVGLVVVAGGLVVAWLVWVRRGSSTDPGHGSGLRSGAKAAGALVCLLLLMAAWLESPWAGEGLSAQRLETRLAALESRAEGLRERREALSAEVAVLRAEDERIRVVIREPTRGRLSPIARGINEPMPVSNIVRTVRPNALSEIGQAGVALSRWKEFLTTNPRENASEGGVFPVIVGTVTLTFLLTLGVVPLGVIGAIYMREYARQGVMTSLIRISVNNLAGVPSIVYGMFGLGFFCYGLGGFVDAGPTDPMGVRLWWTLGGVLVGLVFLGVWGSEIGRESASTPGDTPPMVRGVGAIGGMCWLGAVIVAAVMVARTPYFEGFFAAKLPEEPTFGGRGVLWASLTLALLTLPVVIVATEEAISAVPGSMREGSLGCGATRWQTTRRIVLPAAMPGIMTGAILAMARGAGEVAPLMLVGAVNLAPALPISGDAPFLHGDRTFMHLGFHIYSLGFQSPDSEATEPLVWTTTLLLITIVLALNLVAVLIRARLRGKMSGPVV